MVRYETSLVRNDDLPVFRNYTISALVDDDVPDEDVRPRDPLRPGEIARLSGLLYAPGSMFWDSYDDADFDAFDEVSSNAIDGMTLLVDARRAVADALWPDDPDDDPEQNLLGFSGLVFCEKARVHPQFRGRGLMLRLLREAFFMFGDAPYILLLKAHPDGDHVSDDDCRQLARYYSSDRGSPLREVDRENRPGWLVADVSRARFVAIDRQCEPLRRRRAKCRSAESA